jgi:Zn-dependent protease
MIFLSPEILQKLIIGAPAILFALTVHEFFHAWTALKFGDPTAYKMGRLTLNPLAHLDLMGTTMLFFTLLFSNFMFGWAKPVPVNPMNFRNIRVGDFWVSAAGPLSNLGLGLIFGILYRILTAANMEVPTALYAFLEISVVINVCLAFFNLIPLFPLDGSHMLRSILPPSSEQALENIQKYSPFILLILIISGVTWKILGPFISFFIHLFMG